MKTATIDVYQVWGTGYCCADVLYRGKILKRIDASKLDSAQGHVNGLLELAKAWAFNNGFTHIKAGMV